MERGAAACGLRRTPYNPLAQRGPGSCASDRREAQRAHARQSFGAEPSDSLLTYLAPGWRLPGQRRQFLEQGTRGIEAEELHESFGSRTRVRAQLVVVHAQELAGL